METFLGALLGVLGAFLVEFLVHRFQQRDHRVQQAKRDAHLLTLMVSELRANVEVLDTLRVEVRILAPPTVAIRTRVWSGFLDELFEALSPGETLDAVAGAYESLTKLDPVVDVYARQLGKDKVADAAQTTVPRLRTMLEEADASVDKALATLASR